MKSKDINAFLGTGTAFEGRLRFRGGLRIDGRFEGEIDAPAGDLIIGKEGVVEADVHVSSLLISGEVRGNIIAERRVEVLALGKAFGSIQTPTLVIVEGGVFKGKTSMCFPEEKPEEVNTSEAREGEGGPAQQSLGIIHGIVTAEPPVPRGSIHDVIEAVEADTKGVPVKNAKILAICDGKGKRKTKTDALGRYELRGLDDGLWTLKVKARGYDEVEAVVRVSGGGTYEKDFV